MKRRRDAEHQVEDIGGDRDPGEGTRREGHFDGRDGRSAPIAIRASDRESAGVYAIADHGHPRFLSLQHDTSAALSSRHTSCDEVEHPTLWATATAVGRASPVSITTSKQRKHLAATMTMRSDLRDRRPI